MLEEFKELLQDDSLHVFIAQIKKLHLASDNSFLRVEVEVWPELRIIMCDMTWDHVGPNSGFYNFPNVGDLVLGVSAEGEVDQSFIIKRLSSSEDTIPKNALTGDSVLKAVSGQKLWLTSDTRINLSKGDDAPTENLVLGQEFKTWASSFMGRILSLLEKMQAETHLGNLGFPTGVPNNASEYAALKAELIALKTDPIDSSKILSDISYTEKGS